MPSFLFTRPELNEFAEKTIRWPGHWDAIDTLKECGLLDLTPVEAGGELVSPRHVLLAALEPRLRPQPGDIDACVMWVSVEGSMAGRSTRIDYHLWDEADVESGISSMGRVTGFSAAIAAWMLGRGMFEEKGIVAPEDCFFENRYWTFMDELAKHRIAVIREIAPMEPAGESLRRPAVTL
jgi:saccharopine dehydrogenase-like NADP-dependent oxidoreductase